MALSTGLSLNVFMAAWLALASSAAAQPAREGDGAVDPPEIRALWVDAFHAGIRSATEVNDLVDAAVRAHLNTLFVQVRRRGDALYLRGSEPPLDEPAYDPSFDALAAVVEAAHRAGLEVHAWINAMPTWRDEQPPRDPRHLFNRHGPGAGGDDNWFTSSPSGEHRFPVGYFVDPGHPAAAAYLAEIYLNIVRNYAVDGIHFDYIRYPETEDRLPRGSGVGYNSVSLARFRRATGRSDTPAPGDEAWTEWRRTQVTDLVRRISIEARAINPRIRISGALIPWGAPPSGERDFADVAPMQRIFQDWHQWLKDGLLDIGVPMNYATETDDRVRGWFDGWIRWEKRHKHGRLVVVGIGAYRNTPEHTLAQVERARAPAGGDRTDGVSFFSYAAPRTGVPPEGDASGLAFLVSGADSKPGVFLRRAPVPRLPWIERPARGWIAGTVAAANTLEADGVAVKVKKTGIPLFHRTRTVRTDGNGYYGLTDVKPGRYRVWIDRSNDPKATVMVEAGRVSRVDLRVGSAGVIR